MESWTCSPFSPRINLLQNQCLPPRRSCCLVWKVLQCYQVIPGKEHLERWSFKGKASVKGSKRGPWQSLLLHPLPPSNHFTYLLGISLGLQVGVQAPDEGDTISCLPLQQPVVVKPLYELVFPLKGETTTDLVQPWVEAQGNERHDQWADQILASYPYPGAFLNLTEEDRLKWPTASPQRKAWKDQQS